MRHALSDERTNGTTVVAVQPINRIFLRCKVDESETYALILSDKGNTLRLARCSISHQFDGHQSLYDISKQ